MSRMSRMTPIAKLKPRRSGRRAGWSRTQQGFSLLEVLAAFSILAISLGVLMQIFSRALNVTTLGTVYSEAIPLAAAQLNAVGVSIPLEQGDYSGTQENGLRWTLRIEPFESSAWIAERPMLETFLITATVTAPSARGERQIELRTVRVDDSF